MSVASPTLDRVAAGGLCTGCGVCVALAPGKIRMEEAPPGYLRPVLGVALDGSEETALEAVCPGLGIAQPAPGEDPLWGPVALLHRGHATDPGLRHRASSGGALSAILAHLVESGTVERVIQVAADPARPYANRVVVSRCAAAIAQAAGSRYAPSAPLADLRDALAEPGTAAFVGKPCDVAALRALARREPEIGEKIPLMLSFFCAGVPSHAGAREILARLGVAEAELAAFRYRGHGWPGQATATDRRGAERSMSYAESWGAILTRHVQHRCKLCADGTGGLADLVCADAWACNAAGYPLFDEAPGQSVILARTATGAAVVLAARAAGQIESEALALAALAPMQPGQVNRKELVWSRLLALRLIGRPVPRYHGFHLAAAARRAGPWRSLRSLLGTWRRALSAG